MSEFVFLGRPAFDPRPYTRLEPLAVAEEGAWRVYHDWAKALPTEGRAFAPRLTGFGSNCLVAFSVEPNAKRDQERDQFVVTAPRGVSEVLDFRQADAEIARRELVESGRARLVAGTDTVVAALGDGRCAVVKMVRHPTRDLWVADIDGLEQLRIHAFDERLFDGDQVEGRWLSVPGVTVGAVLGAVNWSRDADFLDSVLKRLRRAGGSAPGVLTRAQIAQIVSHLDRADLLPDKGADLAPVRDRLRVFAPALLRNLQALDEIVEVLTALDPVSERIAADLAERRIQAEAEMRRELEDQLLSELETSFEDLTAERDRLAHEVETLAGTAEAKRRELEEERLSVETAKSTLSRELAEVAAGLGAAPPDAETRVLDLVQRLARTMGAAGVAFEVAASAGPPWTTITPASGEAKAWTDFDGVLKATAARWAHRPEDLVLADAAARGGRLVVLPEHCASRFVSCYAELIAGGEWARHVLDPSVISLDDLWRAPSSGRHACLARAWAAARLDPTRYQVLLLDGVHRTPSALWLGPLLEVMQDVRRPRNLLIFAGLGAPDLDPERAWRGPASEVIALAPRPLEATSPRLLIQVGGGTSPRAWFDASQAPAPTASEAMSFVTAIEADIPAARLEVACAVLRAGWAFGADRAAALARAVAGPAGEDAGAQASGEAWLRERLQEN